jgi:hypothetical protein
MPTLLKPKASDGTKTVTLIYNAEGHVTGGTIS